MHQSTTKKQGENIKYENMYKNLDVYEKLALFFLETEMSAKGLSEFLGLSRIFIQQVMKGQRFIGLKLEKVLNEKIKEYYEGSYERTIERWPRSFKYWLDHNAEAYFNKRTEDFNSERRPRRTKLNTRNHNARGAGARRNLSGYDAETRTSSLAHIKKLSKDKKRRSRDTKHRERARLFSYITSTYKGDKMCSDEE